MGRSADCGLKNMQKMEKWKLNESEFLLEQKFFLWVLAIIILFSLAIETMFIISYILNEKKMRKKARRKDF